MEVFNNKRLGIKGKKNTQIKDNEYQHYYRENYKNCVNWTQYRGIWRDLTEILVEEMLINNYEWKLPLFLGSLAVKKYKNKMYFTPDGHINTKYLKIDFKETDALWARDPDAKEKKIKIYHDNLHTDGYKVVIHWNKPRIFRLFKFYPMRKWEVRLSHVVKNRLNKSDYFILVRKNFQHITEKRIYHNI